MSSDPPEIHWARRFSRSECVLLAIYFCFIPLLLSGLLIYLKVSPLGYVALSLSVLGVAWLSHRLGRRRYAITSEAMSANLAPIARWKVEKQEVPLRDILYVAVKPRVGKIYSKLVVYHRGHGPPVAFDFLSSHEALAASKILAYYGEIKKAEAHADLPHPEDG